MIAFCLRMSYKYTAKVVKLHDWNMYSQTIAVSYDCHLCNSALIIEIKQSLIMNDFEKYD